MTLDETEITRIRFEDLSESLQKLINNLSYYDELEYIRLRLNISRASDLINTSVTIYEGNENPPVISLGKTVYFDTLNNNIRIIDSFGNWVHTQ